MEKSISIGWKWLERRKDIVVYNSSSLLCIMLSHWLSVIADVLVFSQNIFPTAGFCLRFSRVASLLICSLININGR